MKLRVADEFWNLSEEAKAEICNGCGPKGLGYFVSDRSWINKDWNKF